MTMENISESAVQCGANEVDVTQKIKFAFWKGLGCGIAICVVIAAFIEIFD